MTAHRLQETLNGSPLSLIGYELIFRRTPRGLRLPRLVTARPEAISCNTLCNQADLPRGGKSADSGKTAMEDAHRMDEGQILRGLTGLRCGFGHQVADSRMD